MGVLAGDSAYGAGGSLFAAPQLAEGPLGANSMLGWNTAKLYGYRRPKPKVDPRMAAIKALLGRSPATWVMPPAAPKPPPRRVFRPTPPPSWTGF